MICNCVHARIYIYITVCVLLPGFVFRKTMNFYSHKSHWEALVETPDEKELIGSVTQRLGWQRCGQYVKWEVEEGYHLYGKGSMGKVHN